MQNRANLSSDQLLDEIIEDARQFSANRHFEDDVCLVAMEVNRRVTTKST